MNNKLDSFNKDKFKCEKCKEYFDDFFFRCTFSHWLCNDCYKKWSAWCDNKKIKKFSEAFVSWYNDEQT